jgi:sugar phosphate isomerase/epimerase
LLETVKSATKSAAFGAAFDPANFVFGGHDPWAGWQASKEHTVHFHIKDWKAGAPHGSIPGEGDGLIEKIMIDAVARGYDGFATLEPHLLGGGPTGGHTGPELFPKAVEAYRKILIRVGAKIAP